MFNSIADRVKKAMAQIVKDAEARHKEHCDKVDADAKLAKEAHADELVNKIVGK